MMKTAKKTKAPRKRIFRLVTRVQLDGERVTHQMHRAGVDTAGLAELMARSTATVATMLSKMDSRAVQLGTALGLAKALGVKVEDLRREDTK